MRLPLLVAALLFSFAEGCVPHQAAMPLFVGAIVAVPLASELEHEQRQRRGNRDAADEEDIELRDTKDLLNTPEPGPSKIGDVEGGVPIGALRAAIASVDLSTCRDSGAPRGYGHARVTLEPEGNVSKIFIDGPARMPRAAVTCVGDALGQVHVDAFNGKATTLGTTWFVP